MSPTVAVDPGRNPFRAGLGLDPPVLAGRDAALAAIEEMLEGLECLRGATPVVLSGLVGSGRTATLRALARRVAPRRWAVGLASVRPDGFGTALGEAVAGAADALAARRPGAAAPGRLRRAAEEHGTAVIGEHGHVSAGGVRRLFKTVGAAAADAGWGVCLLFDELHHAAPDELDHVVEAACDAADRGSPIGVAGAGLPSLRGRVGGEVARVVSVARVATGAEAAGIVELGPLTATALTEAVATPLGGVGVGIDVAAVAAVSALSSGCPLLTQAYAAAAWNEAGGSPLTVHDVEAGRRPAEQRLEQQFFAGALAEVAPHERRYLQAMAELGDAGVPAEALARRLGDNGRPGGVGSRVVAVQARLERLGLIHSVDGQRLDFSLPLLGGYLRSWG